MTDRRLNVCVDGYNLALPHGSGIATYGHTLLSALAAEGFDRSVLYSTGIKHSQSALVTEAEIASGSHFKRPKGFGRMVATATSRFGVKAQPLTPSGDIHWPRLGMQQPNASQYWAAFDLFPQALRAFKRYGTMTPLDFVAQDAAIAPEVMHWTCPLPVYARRAANVLTIHDLIPLTLPHSTRDEKQQTHALFKDCVDRADLILSVSQTTRDDIVKFFPHVEAKIYVTYQPILASSKVDLLETEAWLEEMLGLHRDNYFLFFGAIEPKKNVHKIVEAYLQTQTQTPLVIVAGRQWLSDYETGLLDAHIANAKQPKIIRLDYLPKSALDHLILGAKATLFPSLYEGFGLPVLEAMTYGSPVITANFGAVNEVAGNAAIKVNPYDAADISRALQTIDQDRELRAHLKQEGIKRATVFSPEAYQQHLMAAYRFAGLI